MSAIFRVERQIVEMTDARECRRRDRLARSQATTLTSITIRRRRAPEAERLRAWIGERFAVTLGRWHDVKVGPHDQAMFQVAFAAELFSALVPWLMLNHGSLSVLVHPNTANPRRDHLVNPIWIGRPLDVHGEKLPEEAAAEQAPAPNTHPVLRP